MEYTVQLSRFKQAYIKLECVCDKHHWIALCEERQIRNQTGEGGMGGGGRRRRKEVEKKKVRRITSIGTLVTTQRLSQWLYNYILRVEPLVVNKRLSQWLYKKKNLKQSWLPAFWKKIQNTQEIKRTLFLKRRNRTKRANFRCNHLFQVTYNTTENNQTKISWFK